MSETLALELRDVFRIHAGDSTGAVALQGMTLSVARGERCVVLGPSGSGKSTLLRIAAGFDRPSAGVARTLGIDVVRLGARRAAEFRSRQLGFLDQHYARALSPALSCAANVALPLALGGATPGEARRRALALLDRMGLADRADDPPSELSGGEQQRVAVARALASRPDIVFADEPTGNLDSRSGNELLSFLRHAADEMGQTIVVVTHDPVAAAWADDVVFLADGRTVDSLHHPTADLVLDRIKALGD
jgi:putative ABC transport system ATP-binding protein